MNTLATLTTRTAFTYDEMVLVADALERLASHTGRWREIAAFAVAHPEFGLLADEDAPVSEELR